MGSDTMKMKVLKLSESYGHCPGYTYTHRVSHKIRVYDPTKSGIQSNKIREGIPPFKIESLDHCKSGLLE